MKKLGPYLLGPNDENQGIYTGDARELARAIPDESVDLIFTDPEYDDIEMYRWLAETAVRILKPNRMLVAFYGIGYTPETHDALRAPRLIFRWCGIASYAARPQYHGRLQVQTTHAAWYQKGKAKIYNSVADSMILPPVRAARYLQPNGASWDKHPKICWWYTRAFTQPDMIVVDPFCGLGAIPASCVKLGRRYLAFEIDSEVAELARERVRDTQPPLFVPQPQQAEMGALA